MRAFEKNRHVSCTNRLRREQSPYAAPPADNESPSDHRANRCGTIRIHPDRVAPGGGAGLHRSNQQRARDDPESHAVTCSILVDVPSRMKTEAAPVHPPVSGVHRRAEDRRRNVNAARSALRQVRLPKTALPRPIAASSHPATSSGRPVNTTNRQLWRENRSVLAGWKHPCGRISASDSRSRAYLPRRPGRATQMPSNQTSLGRARVAP